MTGREKGQNLWNRAVPHLPNRPTASRPYPTKLFQQPSLTLGNSVAGVPDPVPGCL